MIYITIESGIITSATKDDNGCDEVCIIDYTTSPTGGGKVVFKDGTKEEAYIYYEPIMGTEVKEVRESQ